MNKEGSNDDKSTFTPVGTLKSILVTSARENLQ